ALASPSRFSIKPACPAGLRALDLLLIISETFRSLTPENQTQYEANSERCENCFCRVFTHVLLCVFLERADAIPGVAPCLFCFAASLTPSLLCLPTVLFRESACG